MFRLFSGANADELWLAANDALRSGTNVLHQQSRNGPTREILHAALSLSNPTQRWVYSRNPPINVAFAVAEVIWIMAGRNDAQFLNYYNRQLPKFAGFKAQYHGAYGHRLRLHLRGLDQLTRAYQILLNNPDSRQVVLQIWDSQLDLPRQDGSPVSEDIPCNIAAMLKVRNGALEWTQIMRSNDLHRGLPYNLVQFTSLHEVMAGWLGVRLGSYNHMSDSLHIYEDCMQFASTSSECKTIYNSDSLALPKTQSEMAFRQLARHAEAISSSMLTENELSRLSTIDDLPESFRNILCLLCAEGARREYSIDAALSIMNACTNEGYRVLFDRWLRRVAQRK